MIVELKVIVFTLGNSATGNLRSSTVSLVWEVQVTAIRRDSFEGRLSCRYRYDADPGLPTNVPELAAGKLR